MSVVMRACVGGVEPEVTQDRICWKLDRVSSRFVGVIFYFFLISLCSFKICDGGGCYCLGFLFGCEN